MPVDDRPGAASRERDGNAASRQREGDAASRQREGAASRQRDADATSTDLALSSDVRRAAFVVVASTSLLGLAAEVAFAQTSDAPIAWIDALAPMLSLSGEANVPTWVSSMLLFACAIAAMALAREQRAAARGWWGTAAVFAYASLDECVQLHEHLGGHFEFHGVLYFDWVIWAAILVVAVAIAFWPFVRALPPIVRRRLVIAGAIYLGGAIAMELPLGWWTDRHGSGGLGYALIDWLEETLEMIGATLALYALLAAREDATA